MAQNLTALISGLVFALGLGVSGMTQPQKIVGFLDLFGDWQPALIFVMLGAISFHSLMYYFFKHRTSPLLGGDFRMPTLKNVTPRLVIGSAIFGVGWGMAGFCPGPGITSLFSGQSASFQFVGAMLVGMIIFKVTAPLVLGEDG
ncbi:MAG: YeeE/YedE family protein [Bdellovibrionales bacterium]|nr:YeeE/YedE family protein [Bdellovibrionales bacterium]